MKLNITKVAGEYFFQPEPHGPYPSLQELLDDACDLGYGVGSSFSIIRIKTSDQETTP